MIYRAIGITSSGQPASLDIAFIEFTAAAGNWQFEIVAAEQIVYGDDWQLKLQQAKSLTALNYQILNSEYGLFIGGQVNTFIEKYSLHHKVQLLICDGHNIFDLPEKRLVVQLGSGAAIAASTGLAVITDLRSMNSAHGGNNKKAFAKARALLFPGKTDGDGEVTEPFETALLAALTGVLRWREEATTSVVSGTIEASIGGAIWLGNEA